MEDNPQQDRIFISESGSDPIIINHLPADPNIFINKTTLLYGPTRSGKTSIILWILSVIQKHIDMPILFCPTNIMNKTYFGKIPDIFSFAEPGENAPNNLEKSKSIRSFFSQLEKKQKIIVMSRDVNESPIEMAKCVVKYLRRNPNKRLYENFVNKFKSIQSEKERISFCKRILQRLYRILLEPERIIADFNPSRNNNILLLLDDCAASLKYVFKTAFNEMIYQNRHYSITVIISCQDDVDFPKNLRENVHNSIFSDKQIFIENFGRKKSLKDQMPKYRKISNAIFNPKYLHRKMVCIKSTGYDIYHITAPDPDSYGDSIKVGSPECWQLDRHIKASKTQMLEEALFNNTHQDPH